MEWPSEVQRVYVLCHPVKEKARWERLLPHLLACGIPSDKIQVCAPTWGADLTPDQIFRFYNPFLKRGNLPTFTFKGLNLTRGEISLGMNFVGVLVDVLRRRAAGEPPGLVITLESDVWLRTDFVPRLRTTIEEAKKVGAWDYISLGEGIGTRPPGAPASYFAPAKVYVPPHQWVFRCTDSMLFTTAYLERLFRTMVPFKEIIDWEMNFQMIAQRGKPLWADPPLAEQGTCFARLATSLPA